MSSLLYNYGKQRFLTDLSLNGTTELTGPAILSGTTTISGAATFTAANTIINGNVGIGTTAPQRTLTVNGTINSKEIRLVDNDQTISNNTTIMDVGSNVDGHYLWGYGASKALRFATNANEIMRISVDGNVGIGTTNPLQKLCITGSGSENTRLVFTDTSVASSRKSWGLGQHLGDFYGFSIGDNGDSSSIKNWLQVVRKPGSTTDISCVTFPNGNVGIGLTNPTAQLHLQRTVGPNVTQTEFKTSHDDNWNLRLDSHHISGSRINYYLRQIVAGNLNEVLSFDNGNVGIGTSSPGTKLDVYGKLRCNGPDPFKMINTTDSVNTCNYIDIYDNGNVGRALFGVDGVGMKDTSRGATLLGSWTNHPVIIATNTTERMRITSDGNVGIGHTNPGYKLQIISNTHPFWFETTESNSAMYFEGNGLFGCYIPGDGWGWRITREGLMEFFTEPSDTRIKTNIVDIDDSKALSILRQIQPKTYDYVDKKERGSANVIGFIAQEIKEIIPNAVKVVSYYIPNFMTRCQVAATDVSNIVLVTSPIDLSWNPLHGSANASDQSGNAFVDADGNACSDASGNKVFKIKIKDLSNSDIYVKTTNILDKRSFLVDIADTKLSVGEYFLHGQEVDDFHALDKNAIFTVVTAAVQDIDRKQVLDEAKIAALESQVSSLEARLAAIEQMLAK